MEENEATNLADGIEPEAEVGTDVQVEPQLDDDGNPVEDHAIDDDYEEIERDGKKAKVPAWLKPELMMHADYTRKTQEVAEARRAFEAERQSATEADEQELSARANISLIDRQLAQFASVNWNQFNDSDPFEAQKAFQQFQLLKDAKGNAETFLTQAQAQRTERQTQETAKLVQEGAAVLARDIPGWSPDLSAKLQAFGTKAYGLSGTEFDNILDPRAVKLLHAAYQWSQYEEKNKKAQSIQRQQEVTPAATVGRASAPPKGLDDRLSADEWTRRRNEQLRKRG